MDIMQEAARQLESYGISADGTALAFAVGRVEEKIRNFCNITEVPEGLFHTAVNMVCGEYLQQMYLLGKLDPEVFPAEAAVKSISEGDVSISFMDNASAEDKLAVFIEKLKSSESDLLAYRRLAW